MHTDGEIAGTVEVRGTGLLVRHRRHLIRDRGQRVRNRLPGELTGRTIR